MPLAKKLEEISSLIRNDDITFSFLGSLFLRKLDQRTGSVIYDVNPQIAKSILEKLLNNSNWKKFMPFTSYLFAFEHKFNVPIKYHFEHISKVENFLINFTDIRLSKRTLFMKSLDEKYSLSKNEISAPVKNYCLIKIKWSTKNLLSVRIGIVQSKPVNTELIFKQLEKAISNGIMYNPSILMVNNNVLNMLSPAGMLS